MQESIEKRFVTVTRDPNRLNLLGVPNTDYENEINRGFLGVLDKTSLKRNARLFAIVSGRNYTANGWRRIMVSSRSGPVEMTSTGVSITSSMNLM